MNETLDDYGLNEVQRSLVCRLLHQAAIHWIRSENPHELNSHELAALARTLEIFQPR